MLKHWSTKYHIPREKIAVIEHGVDTAEFQTFKTILPSLIILEKQ